MSLIYSLIGFIVAISVLVAVHEFGHYWVAKKLGVKVLTFSIGFGKPIWSWVGGPDNTKYMIARIPLGGYVKMLGEGAHMETIQSDSSSESGASLEVFETDRHRAFDAQPVWKRAAIVAAGPAINFLFAAILLMGIGWLDEQRVVPVFGDVPAQSILANAGVEPGDVLLAVDGQAVNYLNEHDLYIFNQVLKRDQIILEVESAGRIREVIIETQSIPIYRISPARLMRQLGFVQIAPPTTTEIDSVVDGMPAQQAGILSGDKITAIDGAQISTWQELSQAVGPRPGQTMRFTIDRDGRRLDLDITPDTLTLAEQEVGQIGVRRAFIPYPQDQQVTISRGPIEALSYGVEQTWLMSALTVRMLWKMVTLQVSHENVNGPLMIADVAGKAIQVGPETYLFFLAIVSISLGVMNLLPIPVLDGGHLLSYAIEVVAGKSMAQRVFLALQPLGLVMLAGLMSLAFYNDILRIFN